MEEKISSIKIPELDSLFQSILNLLESVYKGESQRSIREKNAHDNIQNQVILFYEKYSIPEGENSIKQLLTAISDKDFHELEARCLFFATLELVPIIVARKINKKEQDLIREKTIDYVNEKLLANNFKWIKLYDNSRGASFKTYIIKYINSRIIDFLRSLYQRKEISEVELSSFLEENSIHIDEQNISEEDPSIYIDKEKIKDVMSQVIPADNNVSNASGPLEFNAQRYNLGNILQLTQREIAFLKALYQDDMNINKVKALPGINLSTTQAYQLRDALLERIIEAMRKAGILDELREFIVDEPQIVEVFFDSVSVKIKIDQILLIQKKEATSIYCYALHKDTPSTDPAWGTIEEPYGKFKKHHQSYFIAIDSITAIAHAYIEYVRACMAEPKKFCVKLMNIEKEHTIANRYYRKYFEK